MIKFKFIDDVESVVEMSGHAEYESKGYDIVCAAASSIVITSFNAISKFINTDEYKLIKEEGYLKLTLTNNSNTVKLLLENLLEQMIELENQFPKNIMIIK